jgi:signal transduction histidine kinase
VAGFVTLLALVCVALIVRDVPPRDVLLSGLVWMPLIAAGQMTRITILPGLDVDASLASIVIVAAGLLLPPSAVILFTLLGLLSPQELNGQATLVTSVFNRSQYALSGGLASTLSSAVIGESAVSVVTAAFIGFVVFEVTNDLFVALILTMRRGLSPRQALAETANPMPKFALNAAVSATLSLLLAVLVRDVGYWSVLLLAAPLWLSHRAQQSAREAQDRAEELAVRVRELEMLNLLSTDLLRIRTNDAVEPTAEAALQATGRHTDVRVDRKGAATGGTVVPIAGAEPAVIAIDEEVDGPTRAGLEAAASLIGLTWSRLDLERELAETERARTALTGRILEEGTRERSRIATSVHDDVLPLFAAAQMQIDNAGVLIEMDQLERANAIIEKAATGVSDGICALRDTLEDLRRSTLVPGSLAEGLRKLLADLQARTGVRASVVAPPNLPDLPFAVELLAYETARGCLANVEKHAEATKVHVEFQFHEGRLVLLMQDDGRGFDATRVGTRSHGLALMRQRAELARGSFDVTGAPGAGTSVRLEVPTW